MHPKNAAANGGSYPSLLSPSSICIFVGLAGHHRNLRPVLEAFTLRDFLYETRWLETEHQTLVMNEV